MRRFATGDLASERRDFGGVTLDVATPATLYSMKSGTLRPRDQADALLLRERFNLGTGDG